ncbi:up-regulator of cell proliferation-like [Mauremys mutica]|uniref:up-regulator of cell proliferation-like n=1 Tax=Mauremys mutica TaxID=74926 RepID=UPI001D1644F1|nr:up-regulator of cell proliferation-like [Mauremys mutica]
MEKKTEDLLLETLDNLEEYEFKRFKFKLNEINLKEGVQAIRRRKLEKADTLDVTKLLLDHCKEQDAVKMTVEVLRHINQRDLAERLRHDALIQEPKSETQQVLEAADPELFQERRKATQQVLDKLNLVQHRRKKLRLTDIQKISSESLENQTPQMLEDLPWQFIRKVMSLNVGARNTSLVHGAYGSQGIGGDEEGAKEKEGDIDCNSVCVTKAKTSESLHPLDVLCAVLLCSDSFLQQEILSRMSMCQFALPLLLPALDTPRCTLLLWAMRDIVRKWGPHSLAESRGFREESLVLTSMPTISFVRLGSCSFSKSQLLNEVLSPSQQYHDFFIHRDMESGNIPREIADGLVEISWYFPAGKKSSDLFAEPVAVTNLRGDIKSHWLQFSFLTQVSSAVFIVTESISEREYKLLSSLEGSDTKYCFILNAQAEKHSEVLEQLERLAPVLKLCKPRLLVKSTILNKTEFVEKVQTTIGTIMNSTTKMDNMESIAVHARKQGIQVDEDCEECQGAKKRVKIITAKINDVEKYKEEIMRPLHQPRKMPRVEQCRIGQQGDTPAGGENRLKLYTQHKQYDLAHGMEKFIPGIEKLPREEIVYFLKCMRLDLDHIARRNNISQMKANSLRVEHFMRGFGHVYETESTQVKEGKMLKTQRKYSHFPGLAADLMLEGFPMELIDGDASNIPLQWVTDVLTELHAKLGGRSRMLVITVLGGQSTGKSTLLNTMFGLQFAVSSGRCTRGAFMSLIKVAENFQQELGFDFILVIDTEGLKAPGLARQEDCHVKTMLARVVTGLSDIMVIILENATEKKDVLQNVVHAFLRMWEIGHKPNHQFGHQNISDVSAHDQNMRDRKHLVEQLGEMTKASVEKQSRELAFSDIIEYEPEKHNWYIPGLWHGVPPMAPVNIGYSESVFELKKHMFESIKSDSSHRSIKDMPQFIECLRSLRNAVTHEHLDKTYNQLHVEYSGSAYNFIEEMDPSVSEKVTFIQSQPPNELDVGKLLCENQDKLICGEQKILDNPNKYFESRAKTLHLIEKHREEFIRTTTNLKCEPEHYLISKCKEVPQRQSIFRKIFEKRVHWSLTSHRGKKETYINKRPEAGGK